MKLVQNCASKFATLNRNIDTNSIQVHLMLKFDKMAECCRPMLTNGTCKRHGVKFNVHLSTQI